MVDLGKTAESGLAAEGVQFDAPVLTQTSSHTQVAGEHADKSEHGHGADGEGARSSIGGDAEKGVSELPAQDESGILTGFRLYGVFGAMMLAVFMFALDQSVRFGKLSAVWGRLVVKFCSHWLMSRSSPLRSRSL